VADRLLVITICPRETGQVRLPLARGGRRERLDARGIIVALRALVAARGLEAHVTVREGCAGGCSGRGPNVSVEIHAAAPPGHRQDRVAIDWRTYVYSLGELDCLATIIDENLKTPSTRPGR
jgi:hypothetical protein